MTGSSFPRRASSVRSRPYFLEGLIFRFRILIGHALCPAHLRQDLKNPILRNVVLLENPYRNRFAALRDDAQQKVLGADKVVLQAASLGLGRVGHFSHPRRQRGLRTAVSGRLSRQLLTKLIGDHPWLDAHLPQQGRDDSVRLIDEGKQEVLWIDLRVVHVARELLRREHGLLRFFGVLVQIHDVSPRSG